MKKTFTLFYLYENFDNKENEIEDFYDLKFDQFSDVISNLKFKTKSPSEKVVKNILEFAINNQEEV